GGPPARAPASDLLAELRPVVEELLEPDVRQRMLHQLLEHRERDRHDVGAGLGGVDDVERVADRGSEDLSLEALDAVDLTDITDQIHPNVRDVVEAAEEGADVDGAGLRREEGLRRREAERLVDADALAGEVLHGLEAILGERALHDGVGRDLRQLLAFLHHALEIGRHHLETHVAGDDRADLLDEGPERALLLGDQRRIGRHAVDDTERHAFLDLAEVRRVEKDLHHALPDWCCLSIVTRVPPRTFLKILRSPSSLPTTFTALAARHSLPRLTGVGPKKMQNAWPGGQ